MQSIAMFGVRRSGNHAFQDFLFKEAGGGLLYNDKKFPVRMGMPTRTIGDGNPLVIVSFEDIPVREHRFEKTVVLVRSAYNAFSSRLCATSERLYKHRVRNYEEAMAAWIDHAGQEHIQYEAIDFKDIRKHRPSFSDDAYNQRWKHVHLCQWDGWEKHWDKLLGDDEIRAEHERIYGWTLTKSGVYYESPNQESALPS
ncbi:MAG: hypothetical protein COA69_09560 [Robiginitomaculum sp.]|nr:MAG: hypothetical protein COA69_09560 [Robiginitomaculum sp.]